MFHLIIMAKLLTDLSTINPCNSLKKSSLIYYAFPKLVVCCMKKYFPWFALNLLLIKIAEYFWKALYKEKGIVEYTTIEDLSSVCCIY